MALPSATKKTEAPALLKNFKNSKSNLTTVSSTTIDSKKTLLRNEPKWSLISKKNEGPSIVP